MEIHMMIQLEDDSREIIKKCDTFQEAIEYLEGLRRYIENNKQIPK